MTRQSSLSKRPAANELAAEPVVTSAHLSQWVSDIAKGSQTALEALLSATSARVNGVLMRILQNESAAEEVLGDVYFQVWNSAARYDASRGAVLAWLTVMARSRALDHLRRAEPSVAVEPEVLVALAERQASLAASVSLPIDPLATLELARDQQAVHLALIGLPAAERQMISLAFFRGLTHQEIADATGAPLGTVKSQIRRGLALLKTALASDAPLSYGN